MRKSHIGILIAIALGMVFILGTAGDFSQFTDFETAAEHPGQVYQIIGKLNLEKDRHYDPVVDPNYFSFFIKDREGQENKVVFNGAPPTDFDRSEDVVLQGKMVGEEFQANKILLKCPSKYEDGKMEETSFEAGT